MLKNFYKPYVWRKKEIDLALDELPPDYIVMIRKYPDGSKDKYYFCHHHDRATRDNSEVK